MERTAAQVSFGLRTRSVLGGTVLGGDDLGGARVRRSRWCWGATRRCLDVRSELSLVLGSGDRSSRQLCCFSLSSNFLGWKSIAEKIKV